MSKVRKPLSLKELEPFVQDYHRAFPKWRVLERTLIARESGPIMQGVGFQCVSTGKYRPVCAIYYLCVAGRDGGFGVQFLKHPVRDLDPLAHGRLRDKVVEAIRREIIPSVDAPLDPEEVLALHEAQEAIRSPDARDLAVLNAYLRHDERALHWCEQFAQLLNEQGSALPAVEHKRKAFLDELKGWINAGVATAQLDCIVQQERRHWGLA